LVRDISLINLLEMMASLGPCGPCPSFIFLHFKIIIQSVEFILKYTELYKSNNNFKN